MSRFHPLPGDAARKAAAAKANAAKPAAKPAANASLVRAQTAEAEKRGVARERARFAAVFASSASRGRERLCADILTAPEGWTSTEILQKLPGMKTDAQMKVKNTNAAHASTDSIWDRAYSKGSKDAQVEAKPASATSDTVWDKARAKMKGNAA